jgi:hypothetical protein
MSDNAPADLFIAALEDLRLGVTLDRHNLPDGDVKIAALDAAMAVLRQRLSLDASQARVAELEAARFSYAKEFPGSGDPDVRSIHENIRKLKERSVGAQYCDGSGVPDRPCCVGEMRQQRRSRKHNPPRRCMT